MKINIYEKTLENVNKLYYVKDPKKIWSHFTPKQQEMWDFTIFWLKVDPDKHYWDTDNIEDLDRLTTGLKCHLEESTTPFTLKEWIEYMNSVPSFDK